MEIRMPSETPASSRQAFAVEAREAIYEVIAQRRDMRHFRPDPVAPALLARLLQAAHHAPSVGYMQPWRFLRGTDPALREALHAHAAEEHARTAEAWGERASEVRRLKLEGIREAGELLVVALTDGRERYVLGRRTLPEMDLCSAACALQSLWLAARAEGLGMGWASLCDPDGLARQLEMSESGYPIAVLCLGHMERFYDRPMLEMAGWDSQRPLADRVFQDRWGSPCELAAAADAAEAGSTADEPAGSGKA
jgi:5,6-dimethylbenzimidazole synthase